MKLNQLIDQLEYNTRHHNVVNKKISSKGVDWHIDHSLRVINGVSKSLKNSNPNDYQWKFNFLRFYILSSGVIPRGKGKSPKVVNNDTVIHPEELQKLITEAKDHLTEIHDLPKKSNFKHPYFGVLNLRMTLLFLKIHTHHHLKIIDDIIKN
ncbi:MAG: hypothetical protein AB7O47_02715 [Flavobacteriales bacterium]